MTGRRSVGAIIFLFLPGLLLVSSADGPASAAPTVVRAAATAGSICAGPARARRGFVPGVARVAHVGRHITVLAMARSRGGVPSPPPLNSLGKRSFAWDKYGPKPGSSRGNVRFNAHTYLDQTWLGNRLLAHLQVGNRIILYGNNGVLLCYRVTKRIVTTPRKLGGYYSTTGTPKLAIVVCSGRRLGPGNWTNRTIWYAKPSLR